jgi:hypothetical protein
MTRKLNKYKQRSDMTTTLRKEFANILALSLPGIFLLSFNIGTGGVTSMAVAGADPYQTGPVTFASEFGMDIIATCPPY